MDDLVRWLGAQLDEDERIARTAMNAVCCVPLPGVGHWRYAESIADGSGRYWSITTVAPNDTVTTVEVAGSGMSGGGGVHEEALARHIAEHDPARVLREIGAKRQLLAKYAKAVERTEEFASLCERLKADGKDTFMPDMERMTAIHRRDVLGEVLRLLALPYADRPGFKESWVP